MRWIEQGRGAVPIEFQKLLETTVDDPTLLAAIHDLLAVKRAGAELDHGPRIPAISDFIANEMARFESMTPNRRDGRQGTNRLNQLFRNTLEEAWPTL